MGKVTGWERALVEVCHAWRDRPFAWGSADCLHFCIACERAMTGASVLDGFPNYRTERGGYRHMRKMGFRDIPSFIDSKFSRVPVAAARRGDWVMLAQKTGPAFGVVVGRDVAVMSETGLSYYPALSGGMAWHVI
ncbi:hypothetical protein [uncultured Roseobacter sp.]|uniref:DUF6950 family protein n=1 Tax=uncultured Roseobacter sp. TaxID=114847 RepID=UPI00261F2831|nr:hypothetical protein [uncultured Roseobacter sp.]